MLDKSGLLQKLPATVILDIGCGPHKKNKDWIGIDMLDYDGVDIVGDIYEILDAFPPGSVDEVHSFHVFEHLPDVPGMLIKLQRVLKVSGVIEIVVPHFSNPYFYSDYTHKSFFGLYSMSYLVKDEIFKRKVPDYQFSTGLRLQNVTLRFQTPFRINSLFRKLYQLIFNSSNIAKEIYEDSWSSIFPCYELQYLLTKE